MRALRLTAALFALSLLATALQAAPNGPQPSRDAKPPARESCQPSCLVLRVSTRCVCSMRKTLPAVATT